MRLDKRLDFRAKRRWRPAAKMVPISTSFSPSKSESFVRAGIIPRTFSKKWGAVHERYPAMLEGWVPHGEI